MIEYIDTILYKLRFLVVGLLIVASIVLLTVLVSGINASGMATDTAQSDPTIASMSDSPNAVTNAAAAIAGGAYKGLSRMSAGMVGSVHAAAAASARSGAFMARSGGLVVHGTAVAATSTGRAIASGAVYSGQAIGNGIVFVLHIPLSLLGFVSNAPGVSAVIQPSEQETVPVIDPRSPELAAARKALPAAATVSTTSAQRPTAAAAIVIWPIRGAITTLFGVPELPYEAIHTGIDISDGQRSGVTPVKAFRAGTVKDVIHGGGLGNHVVVDHGNGVTSVYGHLSSITVTAGQAVDTTTTLGYEGSTGVSTGPHLHFEIRVNGQATDPHQFIPGQPYN